MRAALFQRGCICNCKCRCMCSAAAKCHGNTCLVKYVPPAGSVDGLYAGFNTPHTQVSDFSTVVYRQQLLGFNTVRLPFR